MNELPAEVLAVPAPAVAVLAEGGPSAPYAGALLAGLEAANRGACLAVAAARCALGPVAL